MYIGKKKNGSKNVFKSFLCLKAQTGHLHKCAI